MDIDLLSILRESVYGDPRQYWSEHCSAEEQERICLRAKTIGLAPYLYRYLHDLLPEEYRNTFRQQYTSNSIRAIKYQKGLMELCRLFEENAIRYCVLKGGDFAFNYYPDPAMRYFCDLDIWFYPDDCKKVLEVLHNNGWKAPYLRTKQVDEHYHYTPHKKNGIVLEPHWSLSSFQGKDPQDLWQNYLVQDTVSQYRYHLKPEMKMVALCRHFASEEYRHMPLEKFLLDAAWILKKDNVDWEGVRAISNVFQFESCNDLLGSQTQFFQKEMIDAIAADPVGAEMFRDLFELQEKLPHNFSVLDKIQSNDKFSRLWFTAGFHSISSLAIRRKYKLPEKGAYFRLFCMTIFDLYCKSVSVFRALFLRDPARQKYNRLLKKIKTKS